MRIWHSGKIHAIRPLAVLRQQQGELRLNPVRGTLKRRVQGILVRRLGNDLRPLALGSDGANSHAQVLGE